MTYEGSELISVTALFPASFTSLSQTASRDPSPSYLPTFFCLKFSIIILFSYSQFTCFSALLRSLFFQIIVEDFPLSSHSLPRSRKYSVVQPAQEKHVLNPSVRGYGSFRVWGSWNWKGSPASSLHSRLQGT